ncbi:MAG: hypothetical protein V4573_04075 [Pseudomonadota bacterium]
MTTPNNKNTRVILASHVLAVIGIFFPMSVQAAPIYFGFEWLVIYGVIYVVGLIFFVFAIGFSKNKRVLSWLFGAYVIGPLLYAGISIRSNSMQNQQVLKEVEDVQKKNLDAFTEYCKAREKIVHAKVKPVDDVSLAVRIDRNFTGANSQFNAHALFEYMGRNPDACKKIGLKSLEGGYRLYSAEKKGYEPEVRRYLACTREKWTVIDKSESRYELVLGETSKKEPVLWREKGGRGMATSSVRILDRSTGVVLAEDTMYFLGHDTGEAGCPSGLPQLSELISGVFGTP